MLFGMGGFGAFLLVIHRLSGTAWRWVCTIEVIDDILIE